MHQPTQVSLQTGVNVRHHANLLVLVQPSLHIKPPQGIHHIHIWICGLKNWHVQAHGSKAFLIPPPPPVMFTTVCVTPFEYPSESAPPLSGEEGGKFPGHSFAGRDWGGLPQRQLVGTLAAHPHPVSFAGPVLTAAVGALPTNSSVESNSLEAWLETSLPGNSFLDCCLCLSDAAIAQHPH